ncbi:hypothetical protein E2C01_084053 [Portunus trituberculatus]|uniref:Uncharacterized protein n=1 Tax=Portunus trituberculatus TaxID=210409 RepID=A0A5B7IX46_PORTR|nr:hypothetical protein [Portunus trituberculatus]
MKEFFACGNRRCLHPDHCVARGNCVSCGHARHRHPGVLTPSPLMSHVSAGRQSFTIAKHFSNTLPWTRRDAFSNRVSSSHNQPLFLFLSCVTGRDSDNTATCT